MKSFIVFGICLFLAGAFADSSSEEIELFFTDKCREKHGVSEEETRQLIGGFAFDRYSGEKYQCFVQCLLEDADFVKTYKLADADLCRDEKGDTDCETSFKRFKCSVSKHRDEMIKVIAGLVLNKTDVK